MIFRQLFEEQTSTYTYLVASGEGGEALLLDPVKEELPSYLKLIQSLKVKLVYALDTHTHADHITALGSLREETGCLTIMGKQCHAECVSQTVQDGDVLKLNGLVFHALYTPGHTDDSYSYYMGDRVFTGDTLLIGGTGRTDFQNGNPRAEYESLFNKLLLLPDETLVYPAHDYHGKKFSTIGEEKAHNPRLQVHSPEEYVQVMNNLHLPNPKLMDIAVTANQACGEVPKKN